MSQVRQLLCHKKSCHNNDSIQKKSRHKGVNTKNNHVTSESILKPQKNHVTSESIINVTVEISELQLEYIFRHPK